MESELRQAVLAAARRPEVNAAVTTVYAALADEIDIRRPVCKTSGRCCRFEEFGHRLYVTTMELAKFAADLPHFRESQDPFVTRVSSASTPHIRHALSIFRDSASSPVSEPGCPFQITGLCGVHAIRPFGCRIFFCDETSTEWQYQLYERMHGQLRSLHDQFSVPYHYVEWRFALKVCL